MKTIKTSLLTMAALLCCVTASAYDFEVEGLYYNLLSASEKTCELVGIKPGITNVNIPASVTTRGMTLTVSSIKESAFEGETDILSVSFVNSPMTIVPKDAFKGCTNLNQVELSNTLETIEAGAFDGCPIDSLIIPASIKTVGEKSLSNVRKIEIVNSNEPISFSDIIPTITSAFIGRNVTYSFVGNTSISSITFGSGVTEIIPSMFEGCKQIEQISIPANIVKIGDNAFNGCENLTEFTIEDGDRVLYLGESFVLTDRREYSSGGIYVEYKRTHRGLLFNVPIKDLYIGRNIDYPNSSLRGYSGEVYDGVEPSKSWYGSNAERILLDYKYLGSPFNGDIDLISFGDKVTRLGNYFFENQRMKSFKVPNSCNVLGDYCFYNCQNLESIDLNNCDKLGNRTFSGCTKLQNINWGKTRIIGEATFRNCSNIFSIDLTEVDTICADAFTECAGLKKVTISDNVKEIQQAAFKGCSNLRMVSIGEGISSLPKDCFSGCKSLEWVSLGVNLSQIGSGAFTSCSQITNIEVKNVNPPIFEITSELSAVNKFDATLYIPQGSTSAYEQADVWQEFLFKQESKIPEYVYTRPKPDDDSEDNSKTFVVKGDLTGAIINQINANSVIENLDLQAASIALDNQNIYYESGKRVDSHWDDVDVVRGAPYYSYKYYTAPETTSGQKKEYNSSGYLINVITTCFSSDLTNANLNGNLKSIKLPSSLTKLGENAIKGTKLTDLYVYSTTPPTATAASFGNIDKATCILHVPEGCKAAYENAAGWKGFTNIIEPLSGTGNYIMVHPTNENCQVELAQNDTNAIYQWYKYVEKTDRVIDITNLLTTTAGWGEYG